jgi:HlyD family secretion protein
MDITFRRFRSRQKRVPFILVSLILIGVLGAGAASWSRRRTATAPTVTDLTVPVQTKTLTTRIEASGKVEAIRTVNIGAESAGRLVGLYVDRGEYVKTGQVIARMRTDETEALLARTKGELAQAQAEYNKIRNGSRSEEISRANAQVASAQAQVTLTAKTLKRRNYLRQKGAIAHTQLDEAVRDYQNAQASLKQAEQQLQELARGSRPEDIERSAAQVEAAQGSIKEIEAQLDALVIRAPFDGTITQKFTTVGAIVTPNMMSAGNSDSSSSSSIVELTAGLEVVVNVPEANIARIQVGQPVKITADSYPNRVFNGRVREIDPKAVVDDNVTSFQVRVELTSGQSDLRSGMNVDATFTGTSTADALMVPTVAITNQDNQLGVMVADQQGQAKFRSVKTGATQDGQTQVLEGLKSGERVFIDFPDGKAPAKLGP